MITNKDLSIDSENGKITLNGNKYDLGTQGEIDTAVNDVYSVMGEMGAKNLIPYPFYETTKTSNGITWTDNGDGTVTANGTASATSYFKCHTREQNETNDLIIPNGRYIVTGCPSGGSSTTFKINIERTYNGAIDALGRDYGEGIEFTANGDDFSDTEMNLQIVCSVIVGTTVNNLTFKPMLRLASDTDNTYQPYAKTNKQLTDQVAEVKGTIGDLTQTGVTGSDVATQIETLNTALTYGAGDVITAENVVTAAVGANTSDCYFSVPISKPVTATTVTISDVSCNLYYGTNQMEAVTEGTYTATIEGGSLLVKLTKANTFSQYGRYIVDFTGTFTFS